MGVTIYIINGPNLNLLGKREPTIYGTQSFEDFLEELKQRLPSVHFLYFQSNQEGALIDFLQAHGWEQAGFVLNAGGLSHTSIALADTLAAIPAPVVEVHISNIFAREAFRQHSHLSRVAKGVISGLGLEGYYLAATYLQKLLS
jgi:3-dehydroquinate dehydratase-2